jgi:hypothetical protein
VANSITSDTGRNPGVAFFVFEQFQAILQKKYPGGRHPGGYRTTLFHIVKVKKYSRPEFCSWAVWFCY